jgi:DNA adenine methylase
MPRMPERPFLKWAGGKTALLGEILGRLPAAIETYYEPFVGGGAVFFALARERRFRRAVLSDANRELVDVYLAVKHDIDPLIAALRKHAARHSEEHYYEVRERSPRSLVERAARVIYLNKTGYNGLYRVNRSGGFNVPYGRYKKPNVCDEPNLRAAHAALARASVEVADFEKVCGRAKRGDAVYLDPPYVPLSKTASFTAYDRHPFGMEEQRRLAAAFGELTDRGVVALLSNSSTPETNELYAGFRSERIGVARAINSRGTARGPVEELLVVAERVVARRARAR